jgi:hypothetical protein
VQHAGGELDVHELGVFERAPAPADVDVLRGLVEGIVEERGAVEVIVPDQALEVDQALVVQAPIAARPEASLSCKPVRGASNAADARERG